jgi:type II secretory ATPase GspE/PulE/Tfp pilus assembly ATPase PilB-like protein
MYSLLDILNTPNSNLLTLENNIDKDISRVNQVRINREEREAYLRSIPGQDADVVMVDNIDDSEELSILTNLSLTNHLIISSVQSESASECLYKICNIGIDTFTIKNSIKTIIGQKVIKRIGDNKEKYTLSTAGISSLNKIMDRMLNILKENQLVDINTTWSKVPFYRLNKKTDYEGRIGLQEVLVVSEGIKDLIMSGADIEKIEEVSKKEGMITILEDGVMKAVMGLTTLEEVLRVAAK